MKFFVNVATKQKSILLFDDHSILDSVCWSDSGKESEHVLPGIMKIMQKNSIDFTDLKSVVVVHGPGAFTGLRVAMSVINTIYFVFPHLELKVLSVGELFSAVTRKESERYIFQIYPSDTFVFDQQGGFLERVSQYELGNERTAGETILDIPGLYRIPGVESWDAEDMKVIEQNSTLCEGIIVPFYAKDPNITVRKQL